MVRIPCKEFPAGDEHDANPALLNDETGAERVETILSGDAPVYMSAVNALEVAYVGMRRSGNSDAAVTSCVWFPMPALRFCGR